MTTVRRAFAVLSLALACAASAAALAATPPAAPAPTASAEASVPDADPRFVPNSAYIDEVERQAQQRGVRVHWVNPPERRETRTRTLRLRGTLPARESCHGPGCPDRARD